MKAGKIVLLVFGIIVILISVGLLVGGAGLMWVERAFKDPEGFFSTPNIRLEKDSYAIVTKPANIDLKGEWKWPLFAGDWEPGGFLTLKIEGSSTDPSRGIFIGVAEAPELEVYLKDVEYDEVTRLKMRQADLGFLRHSGSSEPQAPASETFWVASVHGTGTQSLKWGLEEGTYSVVLMNEDASRGLDVNTRVGVKIPLALGGLGRGLLIAGVAVLVVGVLMIYLAVRRRKAP
jgi:hypothetical protein